MPECLALPVRFVRSRSPRRALGTDRNFSCTFCWVHGAPTHALLCKGKAVFIICVRADEWQEMLAAGRSKGRTLAFKMLTADLLFCVLHVQLFSFFFFPMSYFCSSKAYALCSEWAFVLSQGGQSGRKGCSEQLQQIGQEGTFYVKY
jgi:hypothetical protein